MKLLELFKLDHISDTHIHRRSLLQLYFFTISSLFKQVNFNKTEYIINYLPKINESYRYTILKHFGFYFSSSNFFLHPLTLKT